MTGDTTPQRPFAVIHGGDEKSAWTEVIEDHTTDYTVKTFGELFADFAYQLRKGEHANLMHRLNECASEYGAVPMPEVYADQSEDDAHDVDCAMHAAEAGNAGSWPIVADVLRLEVLRLRGLLCSSPVVQPKDEEGSSLLSSKPSAAGQTKRKAPRLRRSGSPWTLRVHTWVGDIQTPSHTISNREVWADSEHHRGHLFPQAEFDELVVGRWLHVEQMDHTTWWMNIGGVTVHVSADREGRPTWVRVNGPLDYDEPYEGCTYEHEWTELPRG